MAFAACPVFIKQWMTTTVVAGTAMWRTRVRFAYGWGSYGFGVFQLGSIQDKSILDLSAKITSTLEPGSESTVRITFRGWNENEIGLKKVLGGVPRIFGGGGGGPASRNFRVSDLPEVSALKLS